MNRNRSARGVAADGNLMRDIAAGVVLTAAIAVALFWLDIVATAVQAARIGGAL